MCLILFAWHAHPRYALIVAANRDEFHARPTAAAAFWSEAPELLAGRDLEAGGTWLGVTRTGRFAAITNYREPGASDLPTARSRGDLVRDFLEGTDSPMGFATGLEGRADGYQGFSLMVGDSDDLVCVSNRAGPPAAVEPGVHGLSNHLLDTPWPKVSAGKERLSSLLTRDRIEPEELLDLLASRALAPGPLPGNVEDNLVPEETARHFFIVSPTNGTRSSTVILVESDGAVSFTERSFGPNGQYTDTVHYDFDCIS